MAGNLFAADIARARVIELPAATTCTPSRFPIIVRQGAFNAAEYNHDSVAPGEIVDIFGTLVGPGKLAGGSVGADGKLGTKAGGTQVFFDGIAAPVLYASLQTAAIVPFGVAGQYSSSVRVSVNGFMSDTGCELLTATPAYFTQNASGSGQGSILNQDYSINSAAHPAKKGSVVMVYMTGLGLINPLVPDGAITGPVSHQVQTVTAMINNRPADVPYAGTAPGLVAGANQVNIRIPADAPSAI